jgi:dienelactone hydrolase
VSAESSLFHCQTAAHVVTGGTMGTRRDFLHGVAGALSLPLSTGAGSPVFGSQSRPGGSQVGTLFEVIQSQVPKGEYPLSYLKKAPRDLASWKRAARGKVLELLHYSPPACDPKPEVVEKVERDGYVREKVYFNTTPDIRVPAYILVPQKAKFPAPAIVALHDHGAFYLWGKEKLVELEGENGSLAEFKKEAYGGRSIATQLARSGYVVAVIDMFYWGERRMLLDDDPADWRERPRTISAERVKEYNRRASQNEALVARTIYSAGFTWSGLMFWDDIRTVDYLITRPEVDRNRIGCVGLSVGGLRSCHLAALDDRIKAAVVVGWMTSFPHQLKNRIVNTIGFTKLVPGLYRHMDYPDVASLAMPSALLVINGSRDGLFEPAGVRAAFDKLASCYREAGIPERFRGKMYDTPHEFNPEMQEEAWEWLRKWL